MPTPFMHLQMAEKIRATAAEREYANGFLVSRLADAWPAFYFGSVAPDYQSICDVPREVSHFYGLPPQPDNQAWPRMLAQYPQLTAASLPDEQKMFVAAYCAHLMLDLVWFREVLVPYFFASSRIGDVPQRWLVHHILLTYLDKLAFESLPPTAVDVLAAAHPHGWLPFARDADLIAWQALLVDQLQPGAMIRTVEIYAERLKMSPAAFAASLEDPEWMQHNVFDKLPVPEVQARLETAVDDSIDVILRYLRRDERMEI